MKYIILLVFIVFAFLIFELIRFKYAVKIASNEALGAEAYEQTGSGQSILVAGDSTLLGTGASNPENSVVGLLGTKWPDSSIRNISDNGLKWEDMSKLIESTEYVDLMIIGSGGNDLIRARSFSRIKKDFSEALNLASNKSDIVLVITHGNIGASKLFPSFVRPILKYRSKRISTIYSEVASGYDNVRHVSMYLHPSKDPYVEKPDVYFANDKLHPSDEGYKVWFERIQSEHPDLF